MPAGEGQPVDGGPNIPASLVVSARTATGFTVRAINQSGAAIASTSISLSYFVAWTSYLDADVGLAFRSCVVGLDTGLWG